MSEKGVKNAIKVEKVFRKLREFEKMCYKIIKY